MYGISTMAHLREVQCVMDHTRLLYLFPHQGDTCIFTARVDLERYRLQHTVFSITILESDHKRVDAMYYSTTPE
jgi:hypothetical protein